MADAVERFESWCVLELMGHVRMAGRVTEEERFGAKLGRIDVPMDGEGERFATVFFGGGSVYRLTPVSEEIARAVAASNRPEPVHRWELPAPARTVAREENPIVVDPEDEDEDPDRDEEYGQRR